MADEKISSKINVNSEIKNPKKVSCGITRDLLYVVIILLLTTAFGWFLLYLARPR